MTDDDRDSGAERIARLESEVERKKARVADLEARLVTAVESADGEATRRAAELHDALARSEARFRRLIEGLRVGVVVQGPHSEILLVNERAYELLGVTEDELLQRTSFHPDWNVVREDGSPFDPECRPVATVLASRAAVRGVVMGVHRPRKGDLVWLLVHAEPEFDAHGDIVQVVSTLDDITERKALEDSVLEAQKLDSIGRLAGGIAHDFNNLLTVITSSVTLAGMKVKSGAPVTDELHQVAMAADRAAALTSQLLAFARRQVVTPTVLDLEVTLRDVLALLSPLVGDDISLEVRSMPGLHAVRIDRGQLEQVLVNLVVNARDALPHGGHVAIDAQNVTVDASHAIGALAPGEWVCLSVADDGVGMSDETRARVFEPFFTTKSPGRGTGLGLASVHGIVRQNQGHIQVASALGCGTTFRLFFPRALAPATTALATDAEERVPRGHETVLVVDDEPMVRRVTAQLLAELGYRVLEASDGREALTIAESGRGPIDLLLTDLVMPNLGGHELAVAMSELHPETRVLFCTGYADRVNLTMDPAELVAKPFTVSTLAKAVRGRLDEPAENVVRRVLAR